MFAIPRALLVTVWAAGGLVGCQQDAAPGGEAAGAPASKTAAAPARSPGKPSAPIDLDYRVIGNAIVGQPLAVELVVSSRQTEQPIDVSFAAGDADSMLFPESQPRRITVRLPGETGRAARQVTIVPQRDGRLYLTVSAEIETEAGMMIKSMAIPISVGAGAAESDVTGELKEGPDGETVLSMPAREN